MLSTSLLGKVRQNLCCHESRNGKSQSNSSNRKRLKSNVHNGVIRNCLNDEEGRDWASEGQKGDKNGRDLDCESQHRKGSGGYIYYGWKERKELKERGVSKGRKKG